MPSLVSAGMIVLHIAILGLGATLFSTVPLNNKISKSAKYGMFGLMALVLIGYSIVSTGLSIRFE